MSDTHHSQMTAYYIFRDGPPGQPFDPSLPLQFCPPKDSDELFFALRQAFPNVSTHSERMRNAVIEFLLNEGQSHQPSTHVSPLIAFDPALNFESTSGSPYSPYLSTSSSASAASASPSLYDTGSPVMQSSGLSSAHSSVPQSARPRGSFPSSTNTTSPSGMEQMTSVFTVSSHEQPKMKSRRKMTEAEKVEYRKKRTTGACKSCSSRKRKCKHMSASEPQSSSAASSSKRATTTTSKKAEGKKPIDSVLQSQTSSKDQPIPNIDANSPFLGLDMGTDALFASDSTFPWQSESDWTLLDDPEGYNDFFETEKPAFDFTRHIPDASRAGSGSRLSQTTSSHASHAQTEQTVLPRTPGAGLHAIDHMTSVADTGMFHATPLSQSVGVHGTVADPRQSAPLQTTRPVLQAGVITGIGSPASSGSSQPSEQLHTPAQPSTSRALSLAPGGEEMATCSGGSEKAGGRESISANAHVVRHATSSSSGTLVARDRYEHIMTAAPTDPAAAASVKERIAHTLRDSGQSTAKALPKAPPATRQSPAASDRSLAAESHISPEPSPPCDATEGDLATFVHVVGEVQRTLLGAMLQSVLSLQVNEDMRMASLEFGPAMDELDGFSGRMSMGTVF